MASVWLTTTNNPYNPFKHFDEWYAYDMLLSIKENRPTCCGYLARLTPEDDDVSDAELDEITETVIDDICKLNLSGTFKKIDEKEAEKLA